MKSMYNFHCLAVFLVFLTGCGQSYNWHQYALVVQRSGAPRPRTSTMLEILPFRVDPAFQGSGLVQRLGPTEYREDYYHQFIAPAADMVTAATRNWLADSGLFEQVVNGQRFSAEAFMLSADIIAMHGDRRQTSTPTVVMAMRVIVSNRRLQKETTLYTKKYEVCRPWNPDTPEGLVQGLDSCLVAILEALEEDLHASVSSSLDNGDTRNPAAQGEI